MIVNKPAVCLQGEFIFVKTIKENISAVCLRVQEQTDQQIEHIIIQHLIVTLNFRFNMEILPVWMLNSDQIFHRGENRTHIHLPLFNNCDLQQVV